VAEDHITLDPLEMLARMCQHIPPPGLHLTRLYGAYAIGPQRKALAGARAPAERDVCLRSQHARGENAGGGHPSPAPWGGRPMSAPAMSPPASRPAFPHPQNPCAPLRSPTR
jgi:hypothetical protein